jgi:valyl-tRNA synthetase
MEIIFTLIRFVRNARAELNLDPTRRLPLIVVSAERAALIRAQSGIFATLARVEIAVHEAMEDLPPQALHAALPGITAYLPLEGLIDLEAERERLRKEIANAETFAGGLRARLADTRFTERAPAAVVVKERERLAESEQLLQALGARLDVLGG